MRTGRLGLLAVFLLLGAPLWGQIPAAPPVTSQTLSQAVALMQQSLAAQVGKGTISDVTLTGTVSETRDSVTQTGTIVFTAVGGERSQITIQDPSGTRSEVRSITNGVTSAVATRANGVSSAVPSSSVQTPHPSWLFPALILSVGASSQNYAGSDLGLETKNGAQVRHLAIWEVPPAPSGASAASTQGPHLAQQDLYLDPATLLPVSLSFQLHP